MTDDDPDFDISKEAPTDSDGHPVHPERGHRICAATKSDRTTPTSHGRERDDYDYCLLAAGWGTDRDYGACSKHPVTGPQWGASNPNFKNGATSQYFKSKLSDRQRAVYDDILEALDDPEQSDQLLEMVFTRLLLLGEHSLDASFVREAFKIAKDFGVLDTVAEKHEVEHSGSVDGEQTLSLDEPTKEIAREVLRQRRGAGDDDE